MAKYLLTIIRTFGTNDGEYGYNLVQKVKVRNIIFNSLDELNNFREVNNLQQNIYILEKDYDNTIINEYHNNNNNKYMSSLSETINIYTKEINENFDSEYETNDFVYL